MDSPYMKDLNFKATLHYGVYFVNLVSGMSRYTHSLYQTPLPNTSIY
nr:MAG TPA: hypothetical protein [Caudoviricetes sp.]